MLSWFDPTEAIALGTAMADRIIKAVPPRALKKDNANVANKSAAALEALYQQIERENLKKKFNFYKKARMASTFQAKLFEAGYDQAFVMKATKRLVMKTAYGKESF